MNNLLNNQFRDDKNNTWTMKVTVGTYRRILEEEGIDITDVFSKNNWIERLASGDEIGLVLTLSLIVMQKAIEESGTSMDDFCDSLTGDAVEHMANALIGGVVNFMPEHKRKPLVRVVELINNERLHASDAIVSQMDLIQPKMDAQREERVKELEKKMNSILDESRPSSTKPPE